MLEAELRVPAPGALDASDGRHARWDAATTSDVCACFARWMTLRPSDVGRPSFDGSLHVTAPVTFGLARVAPFMRALMVKHPGLRIDLRLEDRLVNLALEGVDVAIRVGGAPADTTEFVAHRLFSFHRVLVASPTYLKRRREPKTPEALVKHDALTYPVGNSPDGWTLTDGKREARVRVNDTFRSNALHAVCELAVDGAGIALLPDWLVADAVQEADVASRSPSVEDRRGRRPRHVPDRPAWSLAHPCARRSPQGHLRTERAPSR